MAYREFAPPAALGDVVACVWEHVVEREWAQRVVPDGCVDLIWLAERELVIAGADTGPRTVALPARLLTTGIRLRAGSAGAVLGVPAAELRDRELDATLILGDEGARLRDALDGATAAQRQRLLAEMVARRGAQPDRLVRAAAWRLSLPRARVADTAAALGVSERQLHRRTLAAVGYGPKMLARVARLRRLMTLGDDSLAWRALQAGYASQAHMTEEVRRLTGTTPVRFLKDAMVTAA